MPGITAVPDVVDAPTIGTATGTSDGSLTASVTFTAATTGGAASSYGAISDPGSLTGTSATSPVTVSGLTADTAYTFQVYGINSSGTWSSVKSSVSNSATSTDPSAYFLIERSSPTSGTSVTFNSIPSTYKHLQIRMQANYNDTGGFGTGYVVIRFNSDSGTNYTTHRLRGNGSGVTAGGFTGLTYTYVGQVATNSGSTDSSTFTPSIVDIVDYGSASKYKTVRSFDGADMNGSGTEINLTSGLWLSTSAITSITLTTTGGYAFRAGTTFALYGIKGA